MIKRQTDRPTGIRNSWYLLFISLMTLIAGCGGNSQRDLPINRIKAALRDVPTYSVILEDMKEEGNFFKTFFHKYRVVQADEGWTTEWLEVPEAYYQTNESFLGMALASRKEGQDVGTVSPPGYHYVGDERYGRWRTDARGNSFWEWYGKYAMFSHFFGGWYRPIYVNDYNMYNRYRSQSRPFFGSRKQYGSSGTIARKTKPNFYSRYMSRQRSRSSSFAGKVSRRIGRTRTGFRGRSGGFGK